MTQPPRRPGLRPFPRSAILLGLALLASSRALADVPIDLGAFRAARGVRVETGGDGLTVEWPMDEAGGETGRLAIDLRPGRPLIGSMGIVGVGGRAVEILKGVDPVTFVTVGTRVATPNRPPGMSPFNEFFDAPAKRAHRSHRAVLDVLHVEVTGRDGRATVAIGDLTAGPFAGALHLTIYAGARLVHVETVVRTAEDRTAFLYDAGLAAGTPTPTWRSVAWVDTEGKVRREGKADAPDRAIAVRHRAIVAESDAGSVACFPPPHQFFTPRDITDNLATTWSGRGHRGLDDRPGFGVRQSESGGGNYAPWNNAPPGTVQRLGVFYLLTRGPAEDAFREALRYTHGDRFPDLPGHQTFTSHWHMAITVAAMKELAGGGPRTTPDLVAMFKDMNVRSVHLAEFHGDGHPNDPGPVRLAEMDAMFAECRRLSDDRITFLPGEEANVHLGPSDPKTPQGHWLYLFPRPVAWTMRRAKGQPFVEERPDGSKVYHVGDRAEMARLIEAERGLAWTAHARIKASSWTPDAYRDEDFFRSPLWLGAAWKAMPADLSRGRLGERCLDLLDDMANWGGNPKYLLGEVDVFKIDHTHELYGHMNINYLRLDRTPRSGDDWSPILDALRSGRFFVTTGEVLLRDFRVGGQESGATLRTSDGPAVDIKVDLEWTFPLRSLEVISGDGDRTERKTIDLGDTAPFGRRTVALSPDLKGRKWVRVEAWDVAGNGAFSQPVWLDPGR